MHDDGKPLCAKDTALFLKATTMKMLVQKLLVMGIINSSLFAGPAAEAGCREEFAFP